MGNLKKQFVLIIALGFIGTGASASQSKPSTSSTPNSSDDLYSESIYIHKSAAEVPGSLDSNASARSDRGTKVSANKPIESTEDTDSGTPSKKITRRPNNRKSSDN